MVQKNPQPALLHGLMGFMLVLSAFFLHSTPVAADEVEDEREFEYKEGGPRGPESWGDLHKEWHACKNGNMQSPIDMSSSRVTIAPELEEMTKSYKLANATLLNRGHDIAVKWEGNDAGSIQINGTQYVLKQCHWHSPSEHTVMGRRFDMELHMVHEALDPKTELKIAVIGQLYKLGRPDPFITKLEKDIRVLVERTEERAIAVGMINPCEIEISGSKYFRYNGSLTVPPCTEGVMWTISNEINTVSRKQLALLRDAVHDFARENSRPLQRLRNRKIYYYSPKHPKA